MRNKKNIYTRVVTILLVLAIVVCAIMVVTVKRLNETNVSLATEMTDNKQTVYVATKDIKKGEVLQAEGTGANVELQVIYTGIESYNYIQESDLGSKLLVDVAANMPIMSNMVTAEVIQKDSRHYEIMVAELMTTLEDYDYVDVRISFANGEDYLVLSKKEVSNLRLSDCIFTTTLSELEILRLHSAIIDAYTQEGSRIYTTAYIESNIQDAGIVTYPARTETTNLSVEDRNVDAKELAEAMDSLNVQARLALETRLSGLSPEHTEKVESGNDDIANKHDGAVSSGDGEE